MTTAATTVPRRASVLDGATAGLLATVPMTAVMLAGHRALPRHERYPLPPAEITAQAAETAADAADAAPPDPEALTALTLAAHFGYGAATGALYALAVPPAPGVAAGALRGAGWGLAVWAGSYLGWLPAARILKPATEHPARRNALMIGAHLVWGAALGALLARR
jgi:hypothetical protein